MVGFKLAATAIATVSFFASSVLADVDPIVIKGSKFFYKTNGTEFFMRGVAYQQDVGGNTTTTEAVNFVDPLTDVDGCTRDIPNLIDLRTNVIRVYAIDTTKDHSKCMQMLQDAGIYLVADLSAPNISINRIDPSWDSALYDRYTSVIDTLAPYSNVIGFFAGNEVSNNQSNVDAIPFVKAAARDMKAYIKQKNYRPLYVGYAADDDATIRGPLADYINCGPAEDSVDFFGYNIYSWCGQSTFQKSGFADRTKEYANYNVPVFFAEYGCVDPPNRTFDDTIALYSSQMTGVWSGGIVYEYFQAVNKFGLVELNGDTVSKLPDYTALSRQIAKVTPTGVSMSAYSVTNTKARDCPTSAATWEAVATPLPPTPNEELCSCMVQSLTCVAKDSVKPAAYGALFGAACTSEGICDGIAKSGANGTYGAYGMCSASQQLSFAMNAYYQNQVATNSQNQSPCDFAGNATTQAAASSTGNCGALVSQAGGAAGTGVVTSAPSGTGAAGGATSSGVAGAITVPTLDLVFIKVGAYVTVAAMLGVSIVLM